MSFVGRYRRFPGIDGRALDGSRSRLSPGELGCFMSHYECICQADAPDHHLHILEDDVVFAPQTTQLLDRVIEDAAPLCDMLFNDIFVPLDMVVIYELMSHYRSAGMIPLREAPPESRVPAFIMYPPLRTVMFGGATSYVIKQGSREKVLAYLEAEIARGPNQPIDMMYRILANEGMIDACCTIPFLTSIEADSICDSTIIGRDQHADSAMAFYALRSFFYLARDDAHLNGFMDEINAKLPDPDYLGPMEAFFRFVFSERFKSF